MAKLLDVKNKAAGKGGSFFTTAEMVGKEVTITEDITDEFRETDNGKYQAIQVTDGQETKDWHATIPQLHAVLNVLDCTKNLKGQRFVITSYISKGYQSGTKASALKGDYAPGEQQRISSALEQASKEAEQRQQQAPQPPQPSQSVSSSSSPSNIPVDSKAAAIAACLTDMKGGVGVHESRLDDFVRDVCLANKLIVSGPEIVVALKYGGHIKNENGVWKVVA